MFLMFLGELRIRVKGEVLLFSITFLLRIRIKVGNNSHLKHLEYFKIQTTEDTGVRTLVLLAAAAIVQRGW